MVVRDNTDFIRQQQEQVGNDMNYFLNVSVSNSGISETIRNDVMQVLPDFIGENERRQLARLQEDSAPPQNGIAAERIDTDISSRLGQMRTQGPAIPRDGEPVTSMTTVTVDGLKPYVEKDVYSLPVTLPTGGIRLDFARSAGDAKLSILAVPAQTIDNLYKTFAIVVALFIVIGIVKLWPQPDTGKPLTAKRVVVYIFVLAVMTLILGMVGLAVGFLIVLFSESRFGLFTPSRMSKK